MLISPAYAANGADGGGFLIQLLPLVLIFAVFYFLLIRPQQKRMKRHKEMVATVRRGDRVVTAGGVVGVVSKVEERDVLVEIATNVRVKIIRDTLSDVLERTEPRDEGGAPQVALNQSRNGEKTKLQDGADTPQENSDSGSADSKGTGA